MTRWRRHWREPLRWLAAAVLRWLVRCSARQVGLVLVYHAVDTRHGDRRRELVPPHGLPLFEAQLSHVRRHYEVVRAEDIAECAAGRRRGHRVPLALTFDDDLPCHTGLALPALRRQQLPATFFLTGATLEGPGEFWWQRLQRAADRGLSAEVRRQLVACVGREPPPLPGRDWPVALGRAIEQLPPKRRDAADEVLARLAGPPSPCAGLQAPAVRELVAAGHTVGFHTRRHYRLTTLTETEALDAAMVDGRAELAAVAGAPLALLAYPHGRADARVAAAAREHGFAAAFTTVPLAVSPVQPRWLLPRIEPSFRSPGHFALQLGRIARRG